MKLTRCLMVGLYGIENSGVRHLTSMLKQRGGYRADLMFFKDWRHNRVEWPEESEYALLVDLIEREGYHIVGLSFGSPYYRVAIEVTRRIKERLGDKVIVVWGGLHPTLTPDHCIDHADMVCVGEGEYALLELVNRYERGEALDTVPNLWVRGADGEVTRNPTSELVTDLDDLPFREFGGDDKFMIDNGVLTRGDPLVHHREYRIFASRGCPYKCAYCYNSSLRAIFPEGKGNYHRRRSVDNVMAELRLAREKMPNMAWVKFDDDTFVFPKRWLREFCEKYKAEFGDLPFDCMLTPDVARLENLRMLRDAGLRGCQMGIEAGSDREQKEVYDRTSTVAQILAFDEMNLELGLDCKYDVIIDNPLAYTSDKDALFHLLMDLKSPYKIYLYSLTLYPRSSVTEKMIDAGYATESDVEGFATKSFRQFRVSIDWQRSNEDKFYLALYMLVNKRFIPREWIRKVYRSEFWRRHPDLLLELAQSANLVRMTSIAAEMAFRGELSLQKVREYGNIRKMINQ
ncbi:MAG: cobalamin B12-binding domain-containing protein [Alphaproteobacteria bacterium]|nr:cobalamin B12-binding domain-containing protein [Alphaproteobacteria bacterium]